MSLAEKLSSSRTLILSDFVGASSVKDLVAQIIEFNMADEQAEEALVSYTRKPIILIVNSFGGSITDGFALISAIEMSITPIVTFCLGSAMSMGFMIFISGHIRISHELSVLMFHEASNWNGGKLEEQRLSLKFGEKLQGIVDNYVTSKTQISQERLDEVKKSKNDWFIYSDEVLKLGIADRVIKIGETFPWNFSVEE